MEFFELNAMNAMNSINSTNPINSMNPKPFVGMKMMILAVDDDKLVRDFLLTAMRTFGWQAEGAEDGFEALKILKEKQYELVITDGEMPGMTGQELTRTIKETYPQTCVIALSALDLEQEFKAAGADKFLRKPVNLEELRLAIDQSSRAER